MSSFDITGFDDFIAFAQEEAASSSNNSNSNRNMTGSTTPDTAVVEQTIQIMQEMGTCLHPGHLHSFQSVNSYFSPSLLFKFNNRCAACDESISMFPAVMTTGGSSRHSSSDPIVKCVACGVLAHRSCAMATTNISSSDGGATDTDATSQKQLLWEESKRCPVNAKCLSRRNSAVSSSSCDGGKVVVFEDKDDITPEARWRRDDDANSRTDLEDVTLAEEKKTADEPVCASPSAVIQTWTKEGPPTHWALGQRAKKKAATMQEKATTNEEKITTHEVAASAKHSVHHSIQSFPNVARALQENVLASFKRGKEQGNDDCRSTPERRITAPYPGARAQEQDSSNRTTATAERASSQEENTIAKFADRTFEAVKGKVNVSAVAGGIAGGIAGLALAGPAGAYAGYVAAGSLMVEGAATLGVVVAGIATGGLTGQQIQGHMEERRILTMGEEGASRKVLLVRPNIKIDPIWDQICRDAKKSAPPVCRRKVQRCDSDIIRTAEDEIDTSDKVLLLVSRILNDKTSLAGHVYRYLVEAFMDRCRLRESLCETNSSISATSPRARRDDAHAVIKHVTATLMEERPEFGSSPGLTEVTATAAEGLVFGQLYDSVFEEIVQETFERDVDLWRKITAFEEGRRFMDDDDSMADLVSDQALGALKMLPQARSAADKLHFCVRFLDLIAEHFSESTPAKHICADSLLKMVCQHLILIENQGSCNAQVAFLEEFARDEQLLRGRDGYALVTLQASLHFLNASTDFHKDIFQDEDEQETCQENERLESSFLNLGQSETSDESGSS